jgi:hypothetical protein
MIELADYWMGREITHGLELGTETRRNAALTVDLANRLLVLAKLAGVSLEANPATGSIVSSGWRPPSVNRVTPRAALRSKHITGQAIDFYDPDGDLDEWCDTESGRHVLTDLGLWLEHPAATKGWCHVQTIPPRSGRRVFYP